VGRSVVTQSLSSEQPHVGTDDRAAGAALRAVVAEQTKLLYSHLLLSNTVAMVVGLLLGYASRAHVPIEQILIWLSIMTVVSAARILLAFRWALATRTAPPDHDSSRRWLRLFEIGAFAGGCAWGCAAVLIFPVDSLAHQVFLGFVLACIAAGGLGTLAVRLRSYLLFMVPTLLPYAARQFYESAELQIFMGTVFLIGIGFLWPSARRFEAVTVSSLTLKHDNDRLVDALRTALHDAEDANRAKTRFLADMSYQIRTPLGGMMGMAEILQKTRLTPHQRRLAGAVSQSADALLALVEDVLDIARIESGSLVLEAKPFDLRATIEDAVDLCAGSGYRRGLEIHLVIEDRLPLQVVGDARRLHQVLVALVGCTATSTRAGQMTLRVACRREGDGAFKVTFSILDNGSGLAGQHLEQLLTPAAPATALAAGRTDARMLGMAAAGKLIEVMGGTVALTSGVGQGTRIAFSLSLKSIINGESALEEDAEVLAGKRVMILDDRALSREALATRIRCASAVIDPVCSEDEAMSKLRRAAHEGRPYHLVLIDRVRPRSDSIAIHRKIVSSPDLAGTRVIAMMPMHWSLDETLEREFGAGAFLSKPIRRAELLAAIERAMRPMRVLRSEEEPAPRSNPLVATVRQLSGLQVLVAEDDPVNQEMAVAFLEGFGCSPSLVANGLEAIEACEQRQFDVVLMDFQMPQLDGLSAIRHIRGREQARGQRRMPIVMVTANAFASDRDQALAAGADAYLTKPYSEQQLREVVETAAGQRAAA
jgi:CheY-like chemotaxis protein